MVLVCIVGCSRSAGSNGMTQGVARPTTATSSSDEETERKAALERLSARQEASCKQVGDVLFDCAVEDAHATMSPEEFAALDVTTLEPQYKSEFLGQCLTSDMSPRQVEVFESCLADTTCAAFVPCLDRARPQQS